jgi:hypothetical protein
VASGGIALHAAPDIPRSTIDQLQRNAAGANLALLLIQEGVIQVSDPAASLSI